MPSWLYDFAASLGGLTAGLALLIAGVYATKTLPATNGSRLLPAHVIAIAVSFTLLIVVAINDALLEPPEWSSWVGVLGIVTGFVAMVLIGLHVREKRPHPAATVGDYEEKVPVSTPVPVVRDRRINPHRVERLLWIIIAAVGFAVVLTVTLILIAFTAISSGNEEDADLLRRVVRIENRTQAIARDARRTGVQHRISARKQHCAEAVLSARSDGRVSRSERQLVKKACTR